jgi:hypothetical protein
VYFTVSCTTASLHACTAVTVVVVVVVVVLLLLLLLLLLLHKVQPSRLLPFTESNQNAGVREDKVQRQPDVLAQVCFQHCTINSPQPSLHYMAIVFYPKHSKLPKMVAMTKYEAIEHVTFMPCTAWHETQPAIGQKSRLSKSSTLVNNSKPSTQWTYMVRTGTPTAK